MSAAQKGASQKCGNQRTRFFYLVVGSAYQIGVHLSYGLLGTPWYILVKRSTILKPVDENGEET